MAIPLQEKTKWCPGLCWSILWILIWLITWPISFILAVIEVLLIPFCVCFECAKTACEYIDRIYKASFLKNYIYDIVIHVKLKVVFAFDPMDNARYMRPLFYNRGIPVPSTDQEAPQYV
ncbi:hypothetical protein FGIG_03961 [Fasciola gigantica]|uniref:Caveolin n=1 Tax=Fasciola gigantica TaxID=46835 RepID=A0A504YZN2_FASGI|nr:hypothetical protein FGIG_03961 [Fasciola gigantica]